MYLECIIFNMIFLCSFFYDTTNGVAHPIFFCTVNCCIWYSWFSICKLAVLFFFGGGLSSSCSLNFSYYLGTIYWNCGIVKLNWARVFGIETSCLVVRPWMHLVRHQKWKHVFCFSHNAATNSLRINLLLQLFAERPSGEPVKTEERWRKVRVRVFVCSCVMSHQFVLAR